MKIKVLILMALICSMGLSAQTDSASLYKADSVSCPHTFSIKTNSLTYGLLVLNVAGEIDLSRRWSLSLPVYYSGWNYFRSTVKFRVLSIQPEIRYWLPRGRGMFFGAHFGLTYFNIATNGRYRYQDTRRREPAWGGGLAIGYRTYFRDSSRWFVEFTVGAGAYDVRYEKFLNGQDGRLVSSSIHRTYYGPDQISVSFGYSFGRHKVKKHEK